MWVEPKAVPCFVPGRERKTGTILFSPGQGVETLGGGMRWVSQKEVFDIGRQDGQGPSLPGIPAHFQSLNLQRKGRRVPVQYPSCPIQEEVKKGTMSGCILEPDDESTELRHQSPFEKPGPCFRVLIQTDDAAVLEPAQTSLRPADEQKRSQSV